MNTSFLDQESGCSPHRTRKVSAPIAVDKQLKESFRLRRSEESLLPIKNLVEHRRLEHRVVITARRSG
jgi:hypothetical protein